MNGLQRIAAVLTLAFLFSPVAAQDLLIDNVTLIDGAGGAPRVGVSVLVDDGRITQILGANDEQPEAANRIDGEGKFLIPGLIDTHIHLRGGRDYAQVNRRERNASFEQGEAALASYLYSGVTSIYDAGNFPDYIMKLRADERAGVIQGPRIFATGGIVTYPGSHGGGPGATLVDDWPEAIPALDEHIAREPDVVKFTLEERGWGARPLIPKLPIDLLQQLTEYYNDHGVRNNGAYVK